MCEGWSEFSFEFVPNSYIDVAIDPVQLHLSCDDYEGEMLAVD